MMYSQGVEHDTDRIYRNLRGLHLRHEIPQSEFDGRMNTLRSVLRNANRRVDDESLPRGERRAWQRIARKVRKRMGR